MNILRVIRRPDVHCSTVILRVLKSIAIPPGEYPVSRVLNPEPINYLSCYQVTRDNIITRASLLSVHRDRFNCN
jgi:hypothetical protein